MVQGQQGTRKKMRAFFKSIVATAALAAPLYANAIPVTFDLAGAPKSSVAVTEFTPGSLCVLCGVSVSLNSGLGSVVRTIDVGQSFNFDFFNIDFYGLLGGGSGKIAATLAFDLPTGAPAAGGNGAGWFFTFLGAVTDGALVWEGGGISSYTLADGTKYSVDFNDLQGISVGSATVTGTIKLLSGPGTVKVAEPTTLLLFGLGLLAIGLMRRRTRAN